MTAEVPTMSTILPLCLRWTMGIACACGAWAAWAAPGATWMGVDGASAHRVADPTFGGQVMVYRAGPRDAQPVVLIHGLGHNGARDWSQLIPALAQQFDVLALDLPGFGSSDAGNHLYSPDNLARAVDAVVTAHVSKPVVMIGHSLGAAVALDYAARNPHRVDRLVLVSMAGVLHRSVYASFLSRLGAEHMAGVYPGDESWFERAVRSLLVKAEQFSFSTEFVLRSPVLRQRLLRGDAEVIAAYALAEHDFSHALRSVRAPTMLIWGGADRVAPLRTGELAAAIIPEARLHVIDGAGHVPQLQAPEQFNAVVLSYLQGTPPGDAYALPRQGAESSRVESCDNEVDRRFTGAYARLHLDGCARVRIVGAHVGELVIRHSDVRIVNSRIDGGVDAVHSRIEFTGTTVSGDPALRLDATDVDAAGTRFVSGDTIASNRGPHPLNLHFSVSEVHRAGHSPHYVHDVVRLLPEQDW